MKPDNLTVAYAPHIHDRTTTRRIMLDVVIALCPAFIASFLVFGPRAVLVTAVCVAACVFFEWAFNKSLKRKCTIKDLSAVITGMLLAFNLPVTIPLWQAVFGSFVAIIFVKMLFGGLGKNFANPAVVARVVMFLAFPIAMTNWYVPHWNVPLLDTISGATPLVYIARGDFYSMEKVWYMFLGVHRGSLGETSELALLIGGIYLLARRVITWHAPVAFIGTVFVLTALIGNHSVYQPLFHIFSGGLFLGAIFMATDYVTTPMTKTGRAIFGLGCGLFTVMIRLYGSYPEGVSFAILLMNMIVPFINKLTANKALGGKK